MKILLIISRMRVVQALGEPLMPNRLPGETLLLLIGILQIIRIVRTTITLLVDGTLELYFNKY